MPKKNNEQTLITLNEAARITGLAVTTWRHWIAGRCKNGDPPPIRIVRLGTKAVRVNKEDLMRWIDECSSIPTRKRGRGRPRKSAQIAQQRHSEKEE